MRLNCGAAVWKNDAYFMVLMSENKIYLELWWLCLSVTLHHIPIPYMHAETQCSNSTNEIYLLNKLFGNFSELTTHGKMSVH